MILIKKVLITNHDLVNLTGTELNALCIAKEFKNRNFEVVLATFYYDFPLKSQFEEENLKVINILEDAKSIKDVHFDLIFASHTPVLYKCIFDLNITANKIVFTSHGPTEFLEVAPIFGNNLSLCITNSHETKDKLIEEGISHKNITIFPNYIPDEFMNYNSFKDHNKDLKNICLISNHIANELLEASELFKERGYIFDIYGKGYNYVPITPEILGNYDVVITIGKTVQFALSLKIPTYCYDIFGGPGYLNSTNMAKSAYNNFSGRGFERFLTAPDIVNDIIEGYYEALKEINKNKKYVDENYSLTKNFSKLIDHIKASKDANCNEIVQKFSSLRRANGYYCRLLIEYKYRVALSEDYKKLYDDLVESHNRYSNDHELYVSEYNKLYSNYKVSLEQNQNLNNKIEKLMQDNNKLYEQNTLLIKEKDELLKFKSDLEQSKSWKLIKSLRKIRSLGR